MGDLDNFITGICDGLQAADPRANMQDLILNEGTLYQPVLYHTDAKVCNIQARKILIEDQDTYYTVKVKELLLVTEQIGYTSVHIFFIIFLAICSAILINSATFLLLGCPGMKVS